MASISSLLFFFVVLILFVFGAQGILGMLEAEHMGDYEFLWRNATDNTQYNSSAYLNLSTQRTSARFDGNLTVTYQGGDNTTDAVYVGGTFVGNLTAHSPDTFTVLGSLIDVPCEVHYVLNASSTNVTKTELDYYSYDGCEYSEDTCDALTASLNLSGAVMRIPPYFIFIFAIVIVLTAVGGLLFR